MVIILYQSTYKIPPPSPKILRSDLVFVLSVICVCLCVHVPKILQNTSVQKEYRMDVRSTGCRVLVSCQRNMTVN